MYVQTKSDTLTFESGCYFNEAFADLDVLVKNANDQFTGQNIKFDSMVGIGLSGLLVLPVLARHYGVPYLALRKEGIKSHDSYGVGSYGRGTIGKRWLLIDDFVSSGRTIEVAKRRVADGIAMTGSNFTTEYVGTYCYGARGGGDSYGKIVHPNGTQKSVTAIDVDGETIYVDLNHFSVTKRYVERAIRRGSPDPKGWAILRVRESYSFWIDEGYLDIDDLAMMAVAAEKQLRNGDISFVSDYL